MTDLDAVLVHVGDEEESPPPRFEIWHRRCAEDGGRRRAATVRVRVDLTGAESLDSDLFGKSRIRCPRCGTNLAETWIDGWLHS